MQSVHESNIDHPSKETRELSSVNRQSKGIFFRSPPRIHLIPSLNQTWTRRKTSSTHQESEWELFYKLYQEQYSMKNMTSIVEISPGPELYQSPLRNWCANQRKSYMKTLGLLDMSEPIHWGIPGMTLQRKQRLDLVGFYWGDNIQPKHLKDEEIFSKDYQDKVRRKYKDDLVWNPWYHRLVQYYHEHGHTNVERSNTTQQISINDRKFAYNQKDGLKVWVDQQRMLKASMPDGRRKKLDALGFNWYLCL